MREGDPMKILVAVDFSDITQALLENTAKLGGAMQAEIILIHVAEPHPDQIAFDYDPAATYAIEPTEIRNNIAQRFHHEHQTLQKHAKSLRERGLNCKALMIQGPTIEVLLNEAEKLQVDFVMAGSHGKGVISQILLGSTSTELVKKSTLPVYIVPATEAE